MARGGGLDPLIRRRARHVISENERTLQAAEAMRAGDVRLLGQLMNASHASLRDDFEVSSVELDRMVEIARGQRGCLGARMSGAGFGGCAVALVEEVMAQGFATAVAREYEASCQLKPDIYICAASAGVTCRPNLPRDESPAYRAAPREPG